MLSMSTFHSLHFSVIALPLANRSNTEYKMATFFTSQNLAWNLEGTPLGTAYFLPTSLGSGLAWNLNVRFMSVICAYSSSLTGHLCSMEMRRNYQTLFMSRGAAACQQQLCFRGCLFESESLLRVTCVRVLPERQASRQSYQLRCQINPGGDVCRSLAEGEHSDNQKRPTETCRY